MDMFKGKKQVLVRAFSVGKRISLRTLETSNRLAMGPLVVAAGKTGCVVLFRYGAVVLMNLDAEEERTFFDRLRPLIQEPFDEPECEEAELLIMPDGKEGVDDAGMMIVKDCSIPRLQVIADIMAKSVVLDHYEDTIARSFDKIEPLAASLQSRRHRRYSGRELLHHVGTILLMQHQMVGRVEIAEKPDILWEHSGLERLYSRLEDEYELQERHRALEHKLGLISHTVETLVELLRDRRSLRVEWYIVILILVEIVLTLYEMFIA